MQREHHNKITSAIDLLQKLSVIEPIDIRVEEVSDSHIVLSYTEKHSNYRYLSDERVYKKFNFEFNDDTACSMVMFTPPKK